MKLKLVIFSAAALAVVQTSHAAVLLSDSFDYLDGNLVGNGGWANHSGSGSFVQVTSGTIGLEHGSGSREDVNVPIGATIGAGQTYFASFDVTVSGSSDNVYFAHFKDSGSGFNSRIFIGAPVAGGDFTFGISETAGTPSATFTTDFSFDTTYKLVVSYDYDTGVSQFWVDPTSEASTSIISTDPDLAQPMSTFAFRQAGGSSTQIIDNLVVGTSFGDVVIPEPASALLGALGFLGLLRRRR